LPGFDKQNVSGADIGLFGQFFLSQLGSLTEAVDRLAENLLGG
jgi:hypothetical protein